MFFSIFDSIFTVTHTENFVILAQRMPSDASTRSEETYKNRCEKSKKKFYVKSPDGKKVSTFVFNLMVSKIEKSNFVVN